MRAAPENLFTHLAPVLNVSDLAAERAFCTRPGWRYQRLILRSPSGYRVVLEGPNEE